MVLLRLCAPVTAKEARRRAVVCFAHPLEFFVSFGGGGWVWSKEGAK